MSNTGIKYRKEIDGLRAIAVLSVIFYHLFPQIIPGGFTGVDVFFVLSGYLITSLIKKGIQENNFSLFEFYKRRMKRLLPAYILVSLATLMASWILLIPNDFLYFTTSLGASWVFSSNLFFVMLSGNYFDPRSEFFPLLHTWSIAVEEQFYLIFPLFLIFLSKYKSRVYVLFGLFAFFLTLSCILSKTSLHYYLLTTRTHELLIGCILAFIPLAPNRLNLVLKNALTLTGLGLILFSVFYFSARLAYPGAYGLIPTIGTALLIAFTCKDTWLYKVFTLPIFVSTGLLSYSLYLWHWPIISLVKYREIPITLLSATVILLMTFTLSILSYNFLEKPVRESKLNFKNSFIYTWAIPAFSFLAISAISYFTEGIPQRFPDNIRELISSYSIERDLGRECAGRIVDYTGIDIDRIKIHCALGKLDKPEIDILLYGDSHANHFKPFLDILAKDAKLKGIYLVQQSCSPIEELGQEFSSVCHKRNLDIMKYFNQFKYVAISGSWDQGSSIEKFNFVVKKIKDAGAIPIVFKDIPVMNKDISKCPLNKARGWGSKNASCDIPYSVVVSKNHFADKNIDLLEHKYPELLSIDLKGLLCDGEKCQTSLKNAAVYRDTNHLNTRAAQILAEEFLLKYRNPFLHAK